MSDPTYWSQEDYQDFSDSFSDSVDADAAVDNIQHIIDYANERNWDNIVGDTPQDPSA